MLSLHRSGHGNVERGTESGGEKLLVVRGSEEFYETTVVFGRDRFVRVIVALGAFDSQSQKFVSGFPGPARRGVFAPAEIVRGDGAVRVSPGEEVSGEGFFHRSRKESGRCFAGIRNGIAPDLGEVIEGRNRDFLNGSEGPVLVDL